MNCPECESNYVRLKRLIDGIGRYLCWACYHRFEAPTEEVVIDENHVTIDGREYRKVGVYKYEIIDQEAWKIYWAGKHDRTRTAWTDVVEKGWGFDYTHLIHGTSYQTLINHSSKLQRQNIISKEVRNPAPVQPEKAYRKKIRPLLMKASLKQLGQILAILEEIAQ